MPYCKKCGAEIEADAVACQHCGIKYVNCSYCGTKLLENETTCTSCGAPVVRIEIVREKNEALGSQKFPAVAKKQDKKKFFYVGIVVLMLIMALFCYLGIQKNEDLSNAKTDHNTKQENAQIKFENLKTIEEYKKGLKYLENGEYEKAEAWFLKTAKDCNTNDLYLVAKEYNFDKDIREVYSTLYEIPADMGNADATLAVAEYYYNSIVSGGTTDSAIEWSKKAAAMGKASAYYLLGEIYNGWYGGWPYGQYDNLGIAAKWYKKGADAGDQDSKEQFEKLISSENTVTGNKEFIKQYDVSIKIGKDGTLLVTEKISVYITHDTINNEIMRSFPLSKRGSENIPTELKFKVLDIKLDGDDIPWQKNRSAENVKVRIGDSDKNFPLGLHTFTVNYKAEGHIRFLEDHDELYWNVTDADFKLPILHASCKVFLPDDDFGEGFKTVEWNVGKYRGDIDTSRAEKNYIGNEITTTSPMQFGEEFTVLYTWPKGVVTPK